MCERDYCMYFIGILIKINVKGVMVNFKIKKKIGNENRSVDIGYPRFNSVLCLFISKFGFNVLFLDPSLEDRWQMIYAYTVVTCILVLFLS